MGDPETCPIFREFYINYLLNFLSFHSDLKSRCLVFRSNKGQYGSVILLTSSRKQFDFLWYTPFRLLRSVLEGKTRGENRGRTEDDGFVKIYYPFE